MFKNFICQFFSHFFKREWCAKQCLKNLTHMTVGLFIAQLAWIVVAEDFSPAEREFQNKQRQQSQEMQDMEVQRQLQEREKASKPKAPAIAVPEMKGGKAMLINRITVDLGDVDVSRPEEIIKRYQGRELSSTELVALLREINDYYAALGYVTSMATIPAQDLSSGTLVIRMLWGKMSGFLINGQPPKGWHENAMLMGAMPGVEGSIFNIHISDQIVENLNTTGKSVQVEVVPAPQQGYSYLNLKVVRRWPVSGSLSIDNSGSERADGHARASAQFSISDLMGLNESFSINTSKRYFRERPDDNGEHVNGVSWSMPIGHWALSASYSNIKSEQLQITTHGGEYLSTTSVEDAKIKLNRVLARDQTGKTNAWFEISNRDNFTSFSGVKPKVNNRKFTQFTLGASKSMRIAGGGAYADLSWTHGVPWFNGYTESPTEPNAQQTDFNLISSNMSWQRPDRLLGISVTYELRAAVQYSKDIVLNKNRQYIGDEYSVRGYKDSPMSGDRGAYISSTLSFPVRLDGQLGKVIHSFSPLIGLDYGWAKNNWAGQKTSFISGMALGVRLDAHPIQASLIWGLPIKSPTKTEFGSVLYASLNYRF